MRTRPIFLTLLAAGVLASTLRAQPQVVAPRFEPGAGSVHLQSIEVNTIANAPYMADVVRETVQVLSDGNRIVSRHTGRVMRDSAGRVRREDDLTNGRVDVSIHDPVARTMTTVWPHSKAARVATLPGRTVFADPLARRLVYTLPPPRQVTRNGKSQPRLEPTVETLTERTLEGVTVTGQRKTTTIPAGEIGNEKPILITAEEWRSPELQVLVQTEFNDPRSSRTTYRLTNIRRSEPPATAFVVPAGYKVSRSSGMLRNR